MINLRHGKQKPERHRTPVRRVHFNRNVPWPQAFTGEQDCLCGAQFCNEQQVPVRTTERRQRLDGAWHLAHQSAKPLHSMAIALLFVEPRRWLYGGRNRRQPVSICTIKWPYSEYGELYGERASARSLLQGSGGRLELGQSSGQSSGSGQSHLSFSTSGPFWIVSLR